MSKVAKKVTNETAATVGFEFAEGAGTLVTEFQKLPPEIQARLGLHGLAQKVGDSYAGADNAAEAFKFASETYADLLKGTWTSRAASSGPKTTSLAEAISRLKGISVEDASTKIKALPEDTVKALRKNPDVRAMMATIAAERAAKKAQDAKGEAGQGVDDLLGATAPAKKAAAK